MVNKSDNYDFDDDLDFDDIDWGESEFVDAEPAQSKGRQPITKLLGGFKSGAASVLKDENTQRQFIKDALPDGYSHVYDAGLNVTKGVRDIYREAGSELRKVNEETKKTVRRILPHFKNQLPKSWANRIERYAGTDYKSQHRDYERDEIDMALGDIFGPERTGLGVGAALDDVPVKNTKDLTEMTENVVQNSLSLNLNTAVNRLLKLATKRDAYNDKVGIKLERKKVELAYQQLFAQQKLLSNQQEMLTLQKAAYEKIIHNTGLPDIIKEQESEKFQDVTRRAFYGKVAEPLTNTLSGFVHTMVDKTKNKIKESASEFTSNLSMGSDAIELYFEMQQLQAEMEEMMNEGQAIPKEKSDRAKYLEMALEQGGSLAGGYLTQRAARWAAKNLKDRYGDNERVQQIGLAGKNLVTNFDEYRQDFTKDLFGQIPALKAFFEWVGMDTYGATQSDVLQTSPLDSLKQRAVWNYKSEKTLNVVIPGLLSMIHNSMEKLRTGDASLEPVSFDFERDQFMSRADRRARITERVLGGLDIDNTRKNVDDLLGTLQGGKETQLSQNARDAIAKYAIDNARSGNTRFSLRDLADFNSPIEDPDTAEEIRQWLKNEYDLDEFDTAHHRGSEVMRKAQADAKGSLEYQKLRDKLTGNMQALRSGIPSDFEKALNITMQEDLDLLIEAGLAKEGATVGTWEYDPKQLYERLFSANQGPQQPRPNSGLPNAPGFGPNAGNPNQGVEDRLDNVVQLLTDIRTNTGSKTRSRKNTIVDNLKDQDSNKDQFSGGGWTGKGAKYEDAGRVHKGEIVFSKEDIARNGGINLVERMRKFGKGFASGGYTGDDGTGEDLSVGIVPKLSDLITRNKEHHDVLIDTLNDNFRKLNESLENMGHLALSFSGVDMEGMRERSKGMFGKGKAFLSKWWGRGKAGLGAVGKFGWNVSTLPARGIGAAIGAGFGAAGSVLSYLTGKRDRLIEVGKDIKGKARDLYIKGRDQAIITARDMKSGNLIDVNTGDVISKISDITGEVRDKAGNIVLSAQEFASGLHILEKGRLLPKIIAGGIAQAGSLVRGAGNLAALPFKIAAMPLKAAKFMYGMLKRMDDIYVVGEAQPRLLAALLNSDGYVVAATGKPVKSIADITGEIKTLDGETVLTHSDIQKGLVWRNGRPVRLLRDKVTASITGAFGLVGKILGTTGKIALAPVKLAAKIAGAVGKGALGIGKRVMGIGNDASDTQNAEWLEKIYALLDERLERKSRIFSDKDGDGDRDASAEDRYQQWLEANAQPSQREEAVKADKDDKKGGMWKLLLGLVGGGFARIARFGRAAISWFKRIALLNALNNAGNAMQGGGRGRRGGRSLMSRAGRSLAIGATAYGGYKLLTSDFGGSLLSGMSSAWEKETNEFEYAGADDGEEGDNEPGFLGKMWNGFDDALGGYGGLAASVAGGIGVDYLLDRMGNRRDDNNSGGVSGDAPDRDRNNRNNRGGSQGSGQNGNQRSRGKWGKIKDLASKGWDKTKSLSSRLSTGARGLATRVTGSGVAQFLGRQALWQGARTAAVAGATALAGVVSAPVLIGAAAVGAVAVGGYMAYKYLNRETDVIKNFRINQYGFKEGDDRRAEVLMKLEQMLFEHVAVSKNKPATLGNGASVQAAASLFGVDMQNKEDVKKFIVWFVQRFKPVYLGAITSYYRLANSKDIQQADAKLTRDQKLQMLSEMHITDAGGQSPYLMMASPFADDDEVKLDSGDVNSRYKRAAKDIGKQKEGTRDAKDHLAEQEPKSWMQKTKDAISDAYKGTKEAVSNAVGKYDSWYGKAFAIATLPQQILWDKVKATDTGSSVIDHVSGAVQAVGNLIKGGHEAHLIKAAKEAGITDPTELAMLLAQAGHESGGFKWSRELGGNAYFAKYNNRRDLGNGPNDGARYKGRGWIQLTGRANYAAFSKWAGVDVVNRPELVEKEPYASMATVWYWTQHPNMTKRGRAAAQRGDVVGATKAVNGGTNGLADRQQRFAKYIAMAKAGKLDQVGADVVENAGTGDAPQAIDAKSAMAAAMNPLAGTALDPKAAQGGSGTVDPKYADMAGKGPLMPQATTQGVPPLLARPSASAGQAGTIAGSDFTAQPGSGATMQANTLDSKLVELGRKATKSQSGVNLAGMNASFMKLFYAMVGEYFQKTGKGVLVTSAYRDVKKQWELYNAYIARKKAPPKVGYPGKSKHNSGIAIDVNSKDGALNAMESMGLFKKYGFHRPISGEPWHLENKAFGKANATEAAIKQADNAPIANATQSTAPASGATSATYTATAPAGASVMVQRILEKQQEARANSIIPSTSSLMANQGGSGGGGSTGSTTATANTAAMTEVQNLTKAIDSSRVASPDAVRDQVMRAAADTNARQIEQVNKSRIREVADLQLDELKGVNNRLDSLIAIVKKAVESQGQPADAREGSAQNRQATQNAAATAPQATGGTQPGNEMSPPVNMAKFG